MDFIDFERKKKKKKEIALCLGVWSFSQDALGDDGGDE